MKRVLLYSSIFALCGGYAFAQESLQGSIGLDEIVVTAQKREQSLQSVPIAVTALTGARVERLQVQTIQDLQGMVPNVQINNFHNTPNTAVYTIRGIGVIDPDPYAGNTVSIVLDGVPQYFSMGALLDLYDIERVEILRGPQGTLFGANTTGGVVNVVSKKPGHEHGGEISVTLGNYDRLDLRAAMDLPMVEDKLAGRVAVSHHGRDGYVTNIVDGEDLGSKDVTAVRGTLAFTPSSDFEAVLVGEYNRARNGAPLAISGAVPGDALYIPEGTTVPTAKFPMYASPCVPAGQRCNAPDKYFGGHPDIPDVSDMDTYRVNLTLDWGNTALGDITAITAYKHFQLDEYTENSGGPTPLLSVFRGAEGWQFSQEIRTDVQITDRLNALIGGFYMKTHYDLTQRQRLQFATPGLLNLGSQDQDNWSASLFGQLFYDVSDRFSIQAGIRYTHEKTSMTASNGFSVNPDGISGFDGLGNTDLGGFEVSGRKGWDRVGWKLGADYAVTDSAMLYASWARGFKSGGFVGRVGIPQDLGPFGPEEVDTFEIGSKSDFLNDRLRLNISAFFTKYRDMQVAQIYFLPGENDTVIQGNTIENAGKAEIKGIEAEVTAIVYDGLTFTGSVAYLDAKFDEFIYFDPMSGSNRDLAGFQLQNAPKWTATAGLNYIFPLGSGTASADVLYTYTDSKYLTAIANSPRSLIQPTHYVHASVDWTPDTERWSIGIWGRNLFDNRYVSVVYDAPGVLGGLGYAPPREYGARIKYNF